MVQVKINMADENQKLQRLKTDMNILIVHVYHIIGDHVILMNIHELRRRMLQHVDSNKLNTSSTCGQQQVARTSNY